ncbi:ArnT family glycosyltransferase [Angustibacter sp. McL0619]|uniref:ArnT family glycosyltransferase n=1 Tax=Angustibacter sp. McL0619 TaxID=3415676 RepID=UPI003CFB67A2
MSTPAPALPRNATPVPDVRAHEPPGTRRSPGRLWRGRPDDPAWVRPGLLALLAATAVLYLWHLGDSGWANSFYSAAAQAGSQSWKAMFFGASDAAGSITVDKTPMSLWVMAASVRVFGLSSWSILVPQALMGVAAVGLLYATVRRAFSPAAGLIAGLVMATTPVAALMFRFNNPDALLVLLLVGAAYATLRAIERAGTGWIVFAAVLVGCGFMTKMLQALLVVPVLVGVYLVCAPTTLRRRIVNLLWAGLALVVASGWWVAIVTLVPAGARPYIGGSQNNSILELALGYNGLGRLSGNETGSVGGGNTGANGGGNWGATGLTRLLSGENAGQAGWLIPTALVLLVVGLLLRGRAPRTDRQRAAFLVWGGWLLVTGLTFSLMQGIFHVYYTVALAPAIGALVGMGAVALWRARGVVWSVVLGAVVAVTAAWSWSLLGDASGWHPWLRWVVLVLGLVAGVVLMAREWLSSQVCSAAAVVALVAVLLGPVAWTVNTVATPHAGSIVTAGPAVQDAGLGGGPGGGPGGAPGRAGGPGGGFPGGTGATGGTAAPTGGGGGMGGLLNASAPSAEVVTALQQNASSYSWAAAAVGSQTAAGLQLGAEVPVMAIGGFNGSDPSPTLAQFQQYVAEGRVHYFVGSGSSRGGGLGGAGSSTGGSSASSEIAAWVAANFTATTVGGVTLYDLTATG